MKVFITLAIVALVAGGASAEGKSIVDECNKDGKVSDKKCKTKCYFETIGYLKDDVLQEDYILAGYEDDNSAKDKATKILNACRAQSGANICEKASNILTCWMKEVAASDMF